MSTDYPCFVFATDYFRTRCGGTAGLWWGGPAGALAGAALLAGSAATAGCQRHGAGGVRSPHPRLLPGEERAPTTSPTDRNKLDVATTLGASGGIWLIGIALLSLTAGS